MLAYRPCSVNPAFTSPHERHSGTARVTAQEKSCRCTDPSLQCQEGILPHRYICRVNTGFPPNAVCPGQGFRKDNPPLPPLSAARPRAEVKMRPPAGAAPLAEQVHLG